MRSVILAATLFVATSAWCADLLPHRFDAALVIGGVGRGGRTPLRFDVIEESIVRGTFAAPKDGATVTAPDGTVQTWQAIAPAAGKTRLENAALSGGYAYSTVESDAARVVMLEGAGFSAVYVNGDPRVGDAYSYNFVRLPVPLRQGTNEFLFLCSRGGFSAQLVACPSEQAFFLGEDDTFPDLVVGDPIDVPLAMVVINPTLTIASGLSIELRHPDGTLTRTPVPDLLPCSTFKARATLRGGAIAAAGAAQVEASLVVDAASASRSIAARTLKLNVGAPTDRRKVTFVSSIDGSVQYYSVVPQAVGATVRPGLILSLHGASVEATNQAACYSPKDFAIVVCPTNRRPYGFDWEDWGRLDALEAMADAQKRFNTDPARQWLTGHSMGGHGTWQLGAHFPDRFAAIAPSAGWISFRSYTGGSELADNGVEGIFRRAASASDTLAIGRNFAGMGIYILHGDVDDNVPVGQARAMRRYLAAEDGCAHSDFTYYERPGASHWWGNECVDWPPLVRFLSERTLPAKKDRIEFVTAAPWISSRYRWVAIDQQREPMKPSSVVIARNDHGFEGTTSNVARLGIFEVPEGDAPVEVKLDGTTIQMQRPLASTLWFTRIAESWQLEPEPTGKSAARGGPFKDAFRRGMVFVYGTAGDDASDSRLAAKARYDAETWWYRGNGAVEVIPDAALDAAKLGDRNVVLFGNADTNAAWNQLLGTTCPVVVRNGSVSVGGRDVQGDDLACVFAYPRAGSATASVAVVAGTGAVGDRLTWRLPYFVSGVGYPDLTVLGADTLVRGATGVRMAGFFGNDWSVVQGIWADGVAPTQ